LEQGKGLDEGSVALDVREALKQMRETLAASAGGEERREAVSAIASRLRDVTGRFGELELFITTNRIVAADDVVYKSEARDNNLAFELFRQGVRRVTFRPGIDTSDVATFVDCLSRARDHDRIDEDFVGALWAAGLDYIRYVAIDEFTEKLFMSDERFVAGFRGVLDDVVPGLVELGRGAAVKPEPDAVRDDEPAVSSAIEVFEKATRDVEAAARSTRDALVGLSRPRHAYDHLVRLLCCIATKDPTPLKEKELGDALEAILAGYLSGRDWQGFADAARTVVAMTELQDRFPDAARRLVGRLRRVAAGRSAAAAIAAHFEPRETDFTAWARWHLVAHDALSTPELLALVNASRNPAGTAFLKDLIRRQGTGSLEPWADQLQADDPGVVIEVLDVIINSGLSAQARPLLMEIAGHADGRVRSKAVEGLGKDYDPKTREVFLRLLRDPEPSVRKVVVSHLQESNDKTVAQYVAQVIKAPIFLEFDGDEQRLFFETLARVGGQRFLGVFRERLRMEEGNALTRLLSRGSRLEDEPMRRAALFGLAAMRTGQAMALINEVKGKATLELAQQCEIAMRLAQRKGPAIAEKASIELEEEAPEAVSAEQARKALEVGRDRMGDRLIFSPASLDTRPPARPKPTLVDAALADPTKAAPASGLKMRGSTEGRPLLGENEVFLPEDRRNLQATPNELTDGVWVLSDVSMVMVGVQLQRPEPARAPAVAVAEADGSVEEAPRTPMVAGPVRIVERRAPAAGGEWTHDPDASLEDILQSYVTDEALERRPEPEPVRKPERTPGRKPGKPAKHGADGSVDDLLKDFLDLDLGD
jgi:hypothetical protein